MDKPFVAEEKFLGLPALRFGAGGYEAVFVPEAGGNLVRLVDCKTGAELLRFPDERDMSGEEFKANSVVYGIPVLFFPNRIEGGRFTYNGRLYELPQNEGNNHLHGFLHNRAWSAADAKVTTDTASVCAVFRCDEETDFYKYFPHAFTFRLTYTLSSEGLRQDTEIYNAGEMAMPLGLGYHTTFNLPFCGGAASDYRLHLNVAKKWEVRGMIPTGRFLPLAAEEKEMAGDGLSVDEHVLDEMLYTLSDGGFVLKKNKGGMKICYELDKKFCFGVLWNNGGGKGFVCAEPQTWAVNAPNIPLTSDVTGFTALPPRETWRTTCRIAVRDCL